MAAGASGKAAVLLVQGSAEAEAVTKRSGLSIVELLRPFTTIDTRAFSISTVGEPYKLKSACAPLPHVQRPAADNASSPGR